MEQYSIHTTKVSESIKKVVCSLKKQKKTAQLIKHNYINYSDNNTTPRNAGKKIQAAQHHRGHAHSLTQRSPKTSKSKHTTKLTTHSFTMDLQHHRRHY